MLDSGTIVPLTRRLSKTLAKIGLPPPKNIMADAAYSNKQDIDDMAAYDPEIPITAPPKVSHSII